MKHLSFFIIFFLYFGLCHSQLEFEENIIVDIKINPRNPYNVFALDFDGDGDNDVIQYSTHTPRLSWYENMDGLGAFSELNIIPIDSIPLIQVLVSDIDNDGDLDIIYSSETNDKIAWIENLDGNEEYSESKNISNSVGIAKIIVTTDIDQDGDLDILFYSKEKQEISWIENLDGIGSFGDVRIVTDSIPFVVDLDYGDMDGDGDLDVLSASYNDKKIVWYENMNGLGDFSEQIVIELPLDKPSSVISVDMDGDGDLDVLLGSWNSVGWYENIDGLGDFSGQTIIASLLNTSKFVYASDIDEDGDMDVLVASANTDTIAWYENLNGLGDFGEQRVISTLANRPSSVYTSDLDGDGDLDAVSSSYTDDKIAWYENMDGLGDFGDEQELSNNIVNYLITAHAADLDGDGDMDVLSASYNDKKIAWYENMNGLGDYGDQKIIATKITNPAILVTGDIDGDGDIDVVTISKNTNAIYWFENLDGLGTFGEKNKIETRFEKAKMVKLADMDNDGDLDIVSGSEQTLDWFPDAYSEWHENIDGLGDFSISHTISFIFHGTLTIDIGDVDNDGDVDVLHSSKSTRWIENINETFDVYHPISSNSGFNVLVDIDGDGDLDVLYSGTNINTNKIYWQKNLDGMGTFGDSIYISNSYPLTFTLPIDIDGDGDKEVFVSALVENRIPWFETIGGEISTEEQYVDTDLKSAPIFKYAADLDGDQVEDLIFITKNDKLAWFKNLGPVKVNEQKFLDVKFFPNPTTSIVNSISQSAISTKEIYNTTGQKVMFFASDQEIDLTSLPDNLYFIKVYDKEGNYGVYKIIKQSTNK